MVEASVPGGRRRVQRASPMIKPTLLQSLRAYQCRSEDSVSTAVVGAPVNGEAVAVERGAHAAALAAPGLASLLHRDGGDQQAHDGIQPPRAGGRVADEADQ